MFSSRTPSDFAENALSVRLRTMGSAGALILDLTESNPTRAGFAVPSGFLSRLADPAATHYSPDPRGLLSARQAVARDYETRGARVDPEHVILTASSSESYSLLFKLLGNPGDEILVPRPSYPLFNFLAELDGLQVRPYPLRFDHEWHQSADTLAGLITGKTRAAVVVHPNNPTGSFLKVDEAKALVALAAERGLAIIADEVFADFAFDLADRRRQATFANHSDALCFALGGLSKSCALPQMKLGWIAVSGPAELRDEALSRLEFIADHYLSVGTPVQHALPGILEDKASLQAPILARLKRNLAALSSAVARRPELTLLPIEGGWSAMVQCPATRSDEDRALIALESGILVHPGHFFDIDAGCHLVVSLLPAPEIFDAALTPLMNAAVR